MPARVTWLSDDRCVVGETTFQLLPQDIFDGGSAKISTEGADLLLFKDRPMVERYAELIEELRPQNIVELGILEGGGTGLLLELAQPSHLVAIDRNPPTRPKLQRQVSRRGFDRVLHIHDDVDQADRARLAAIVSEAIDDEPLDLVIDDCSHLYPATRASFNELFPRVRPGGLYWIEDWPWAHAKQFADLWGDQVPLTRFVLELSLAVPAARELISELAIDVDMVQLRRGDAEIDPSGFDILDRLDPTGHALLAGDERLDVGARTPRA